MRLTVGPLPAAVYWRRRAAVLGVLLVIVLLIVYSCGGSTPSSADQGRRAGTNGTLPTATPSGSSSSSPTVTPSTSPAATPNGSLSPSTPPASAPPVDCTDAEMSVKASISSTSATTGKLQYGGTFVLRLVIANVSDRTCTRDVGSVPEELLIEHGTTKIWSSDDCTTSTVKAHDVRTFHPGDAISAQVSWSSYDITTSTCKRSTTPAAVGAYQLIGRVGTKISTPTAFTIQK
jgi:hypothetical protein